MPDFTDILTAQEAEAFEDALRDYLPTASPAVLGLTVPAASETLAVPDSYADRRCLVTPAARILLSRAFAAADGMQPPGRSLNRLREQGKLAVTAHQYACMTEFAVWVEWVGSCCAIALAMYYDEGSETATLASWAEVREDVFRAVAAFEQRMAVGNWATENP